MYIDGFGAGKAVNSLLEKLGGSSSFWVKSLAATKLTAALCLSWFLAECPLQKVLLSTLRKQGGSVTL